MSSPAQRAKAPRVIYKDNAFTLKRPLDDTDVDLLERVHMAACREDFYTFRKYINPGMIEGWYQAEVAEHLQQFYHEWKAGLKPVLVLEAPPQHGKSKQVIDFLAWCSGHDADLNSIYASYSDNLGLVANMSLQRIIDGERFQRVFSKTKLSTNRVVTISGKPARNSYHLEFVGGTGSFRNTTVRGQITGMGLKLGVIDDPIKGREEASSETIRNKTWFWFTDDFFTRFAEDAALLMIMTRWNIDDPVGRFIEHYPDCKVLKYPALGRIKGGEWVADESSVCEALFPELKSKKFLLKRKKILVNSSWQSLYQQSPIIVGGDMFPVEQFGLVSAVPVDGIVRSVRYWDKAGTEGGTGAYTAGVLIHKLSSGRFLISDVITGHWGALAREKRIKQTAELDNQEYMVHTYVEQEPGSGGKESAEATVRNLAGYFIAADKVTGAKELRSEPYAAQVQAGNVDLLIAEWNKTFMAEHEMFPNGKYKDQVDAAGGAFIKVTAGSKEDGDYDTSMSWVEDDDEGASDETLH